MDHDRERYLETDLEYELSVEEEYHRQEMAAEDAILERNAARISALEIILGSYEAALEAFDNDIGIE